MTREAALTLLYEYTKTDSLRKHALAVEAVMRAYARKHGENEEEWGNVGLLHDFDYEMYPTVPDHPMKGNAILAERGFAEHLRKAILGHVPALEVPRDTLLAKTLFACDELSGFVVACALVRPTKLSDLMAASVKKKLKDKAFARTVSREDIQIGIEELQVSPDEHIQFVIESLKPIAQELGF